MQKMMTYSEANSVLEVSLSPNNRCLSKAVAIANDANPDLLASFANNRLVPASVVEKAAHAEVLHFFCDENGNNLGTNYTVNVPEGQGAFVVYTRILVNGQTPSTSWFNLVSWRDRAGDLSSDDEYYSAYPYIGADNFSYVDDHFNSNGIIKHTFYAGRQSGKIETQSQSIGINWSSAAKSAGININDSCYITLNVNPISHSHNLSKTILYFGRQGSSQKKIAVAESLTINGFSNPTITKIQKEQRMLSINVGDIDTSQWFSTAYIRGNQVIVSKSCIPGFEGSTSGYQPSTDNYNDLYLISDGSKSLYLRVTNDKYDSSYVQPGQSGDHTYSPTERQIPAATTSPDPTSSSVFFMLGMAGSGSCAINTNGAGSYIRIVNSSLDSCSTRARIVIIAANTGQASGRSDWFTVDDGGQFDVTHLDHNLLENQQVVSMINTALSQGAYIYLEAETNQSNIPTKIIITNSEQD